jgi:uncharacterized protein YeaO (DUF488 family)
MLKETWLGNVKNVKDKGIVIEVTRSKGYVLSPSWNLLRDYKKGKIDWAEYTERFYKEMDNDACRAEMKRIWELSLKQDVYLVCFEKEGNCHRHLLIEMMSNLFVHGADFAGASHAKPADF